MNAKLEAKLTMFRGIEQHLDTNSAIFSTITALGTAFNAFKAVIADIISTEQLTVVSLSGIAGDKSNSKSALSELAADIAGLIGAYAVTTGNTILEAEVKHPVSRLKRTRDEQLTPICQIIHDRAFEHKNALKEYGVTDAKLTGLQTAIADYSAKTPNPRTAINNRKTQSANLRNLFRQGDTILTKQIDKLVKNFRNTHPDFYETYINLREIPATPTTSTQLKGIITDSADNAPIKGATVTIVELGKTAATNTAGEYIFKPVEHGEYTIKVTKNGYQPFEADEIEVKLGDIKHLNVSLMI